ncbi:sestrin-1-like isoform X2 [Lineus longissimus]|uniref:sestrin-1-like isoform X2 n=1 Tax=Lineus longissimus TaxID=88925 RepID=UPI00315D6BCE
MHGIQRGVRSCLKTINELFGVQPVDCDDEETQSLFVDAFLQNNRLEHMVQVMGYHPEYLDCFLRTQHYMLRGDGPLPYEYRHYIAILAAARHQCSYLVKLHTTEFLLQGGDPQWLKGLDNIPQKLKDLNEVNKLLAHRPWLINKTHIEKLTRGSDNWSMSEVMHALVLLAHFHALSSFIYGSGINAEIDHENGHTFDPADKDDMIDEIEPQQEANHENQLECHQSGHGSVFNSNSASPNSFQDNGGGMIDTILMRMKKLTEEEPAETTQEEMLKRFEKVEHQSAQLPTSTSKPSPKADMLLYVDDADFTYEDFAMRGPVSKIPTFRAQDYTWEDHGYSLANRLYTDIGTLIDDKFRIAYNLTYYTMGDNVDVDTSAFRRAIWNYIHCMFGIRHDDYDYGEVNILLERSLKSYIKTVTCYPEQTTKKDYDSFMLEFKDSEKVHVNLMLLEARLQAELLYALRAITRYMT